MLKMRVPEWARIPLAAAQGWNRDNAFQHSAAVSFYTLFSLAPVTIIVLGVASMVVGRDLALAQVTVQLSELVGQEAAKLIVEAVQRSQAEKDGWAGAAMGFVMLLVGATTVFGQLQESLNAIWGVRARPDRKGWVVLLARRVVSFAMVLTVGFLLLVSLVLTTALSAMLRYAEDWVGVPAPVLQAVDVVTVLGVITVLFAMVFKFMPDVVQSWRDVWRGAFVTALLFSVGRVLIAWYLGHSTVASVYGAAGSLAALLIWIYYSCAILFFGVEYTKARAELKGRPARPKATAVLVREEVVEESERERERQAERRAEEAGGHVPTREEKAAAANDF
jgi:membrane protein